MSVARAKSRQGAAVSKNNDHSPVKFGLNVYVIPQVTSVNFQSLWRRQANSPLASHTPSIDVAYARPELAGIEASVKQVLDFVREAFAKYDLTVPSAAPVTDPLEAARGRGESYMRSQLDDPDNLNLDMAASYVGASGRHINELRQRGELYALVLQGNTRGFRYPKWQFDTPRERRAPVLQKMTGMGLGCWAIHDFMIRPNEHLGRSPREALTDPDFLLKRVEDAVDVRFGGGDQGAS